MKSTLIFCLGLLASPHCWGYLSCPALFQGALLVSASELGVTQDRIGKDWAEVKLGDLEAEFSQKSQDYKNPAELIAAKTATKPLAAIRDRSGQVRLIDSHHKFYAFTRFAASEPFKVFIKIQKDYTHTNSATGAPWKDQDMIDDMVANHFLQMGSGDRATLNTLRALPSHVTNMEDSPERSLLGFVFRELPTLLKGSDFTPMIQFELADKMREAGLDIMNTESPLSPEHIEETKEFLLSCKSCLKFLKKQIQTPNKSRAKTVKAFLNEALNQL